MKKFSRIFFLFLFVLFATTGSWSYYEYNLPCGGGPLGLGCIYKIGFILWVYFSLLGIFVSICMYIFNERGFQVAKYTQENIQQEKWWRRKYPIWDLLIFLLALLLLLIFGGNFFGELLNL